MLVQNAYYGFLMVSSSGSGNHDKLEIQALVGKWDNASNSSSH